MNKQIWVEITNCCIDGTISSTVLYSLFRVFTKNNNNNNNIIVRYNINNKFMGFSTHLKTYTASSLSDNCNLNHVRTCFHSFFNYLVVSMIFKVWLYFVHKDKMKKQLQWIIGIHVENGQDIQHFITKTWKYLIPVCLCVTHTLIKTSNIISWSLSTGYPLVIYEHPT